MSIVIIKGAPKTGKSLIANALRNDHIAKGCGTLLIDEQNDAGMDVLVEKLLVGDKMPKEAPKDLSSLPWKKTPMVIVVGDKTAVLDAIEAALPGFKALMGPVYYIETVKA